MCLYTLKNQIRGITITADRILAEQIKLLFAALPMSLAGSIINSSILVAVLWQVENHVHLLIWLAVLLLVTGLRGLCLYRYHHQAASSELNQQHCLRYLLLTTLLAGLVWGAVSLLLFPHDSVPHQAFIAFVMAGNSAAAIIGLSYIRQAALAFVLPALLPLIVQLFLLQTSMSTAMGIMVSLFLLMSLTGIRRNFDNTQQNITLRMESTEHEQALMESQQKLALHVEQTPLAVIEWSIDFHVTDWNPAAESIFGYTKAEVMGKHAIELIVPDEAKPLIDDIWAALLQQKGGLKTTNENITKDGRRITCEWYNTPLINQQGEVIGVASLAQDISERLRIEQMQTDFISTVSHELRTPLTSIRGAISLFKGQALAPDSDEYKQILNIANNNTERLLMIINDILDIHKFESGKMQMDFQDINLAAFLKDAVASNHNYAEQYQVSYNLQPVDETLVVKADSNRLMQVMYNLLSNAAKFSRSAQSVEIEAYQHEGMARIVVIDHGAGIEAEFMPQVFDRFSRQDSSNIQQTGGTGLGLSIVKKIIEQHGGKISLQSTIGQGTRVYVDLPLI